jgi:hypothetical protein
MAWAKESGHFYTQDGEPAYTVIGYNGKERPTTIRDARELGLLPSVTSIIRCAASPALERWKAEQLLMAGLTLPRNPDESEKSWIARVWRDSSEQGKKAAEHGTRIHGALEGHFQGKAPDEEMWPYVKGTAECLKPLGDRQWKAERSFASVAMGYGGKVDLHADGVVLDFKGKDGDLAGVSCYDEHFMQLAAYAMGLNMPAAQCGIVFVSRTHPGVAKLILHSDEQRERGWQMFSGLLNYWRAAKEAA